MSDFPEQATPQLVSVAILDGSEPPVKLAGIFQPQKDEILEGFLQPAVDADVTVALNTSDPGASASAGLAPGTKIRVGYGDHSGYHEFDSTVVDARPGEPATVVIEPARDVTTMQRRRHIRADVDLPVACALLDPDEMVFLRATGTIGNLGAGGLGMAIGQADVLVEGAMLALAVTLPTSAETPLMALAQVVAIELPDSHDEAAVVRMKFTQIGSPEKDMVERYVYRTLGGAMPAKLWTRGKVTQIAP